MGGHIERTEDVRNAYKILTKKLKGRVHAEEIIIDTKINIRMDHREIEQEGVDWIQLTQDEDQWRDVVNAVMSLLVA
jgi:hypothetical protein